MPKVIRKMKKFMQKRWSLLSPTGPGGHGSPGCSHGDAAFLFYFLSTSAHCPSVRTLRFSHRHERQFSGAIFLALKHLKTVLMWKRSRIRWLIPVHISVWALNSIAEANFIQIIAPEAGSYCYYCAHLSFAGALCWKGQHSSKCSSHFPTQK